MNNRTTPSPDQGNPPRTELDPSGAKEATEFYSVDEEPEVADLEPDEAADVLETREEAENAKPTRDDQRDEDLISLDPSD